MDKVKINKTTVRGMAGLAEALQEDWSRRRVHADRQSAQHYGSGVDQVPSPAQRVPDGARFLGRKVLSRALPYAESQLRARAQEAGLDYRSVRQPMGLRYLGHSALQTLKEHSQAVSRGTETDEIPNPHVRIIQMFDDILNGALEDEEFNGSAATDQATVYTDGVRIKRYEKPDALSMVMVGVDLAANIDPGHLLPD